MVASSAGGIYNVFAFDANGQLAKPTHIRKEIGGGLHPRFQSSAHPHSCFSIPREPPGKRSWLRPLKRFPSTCRKADSIVAAPNQSGRRSRPHRSRFVALASACLEPAECFRLTLRLFVRRRGSGLRARAMAHTAYREPTGQGALLQADNRTLVAAINTSRESVLTVLHCRSCGTFHTGSPEFFYAAVAHPEGQSCMSSTVPRAAFCSGTADQQSSRARSPRFTSLSVSRSNSL